MNLTHSRHFTMASIPYYIPKQMGGVPIPFYRHKRQRGGIIGYGQDPFFHPKNPYWEQIGAGSINIPVYKPRQSGGGLIKSTGRRFLKMGQDTVIKLKDQALKRGVQALKNVASDAIDGKDLKQALQDEKTRMHIDLKRKRDKVLSKKTVKKNMSGIKKRKLNSTVIDALFD